MKWPDGMLNILTSFISGKPCIGHNAPFKPWCNLKHLMNLRWTHPHLFLAVCGNEGIPESFEVVLCYIPILGHFFRCWDITNPRKTGKRKQLVACGCFRRLVAPKILVAARYLEVGTAKEMFFFWRTSCAIFRRARKTQSPWVHCISSWIIFTMQHATKPTVERSCLFWPPCLM